MEKKQIKKRNLSLKKVVNVAFKLLDKQGLQALSSNLAKKLNIEAMSLYNYVKNELLSIIIDKIQSEISWDDNQTWKKAMTDRALSTKAVYTRHPWAIQLVDSSKEPGMQLLF